MNKFLKVLIISTILMFSLTLVGCCKKPAPVNNVVATVEVLSDNLNWGTVTGGGEYEVGEEVELTAVVKTTGYLFLKWNDGVETSQRTITVSKDITYIAEFVAGETKLINGHNVTVINAVIVEDYQENKRDFLILPFYRDALHSWYKNSLYSDENNRDHIDIKTDLVDEDVHYEAKYFNYVGTISFTLSKKVYFDQILDDINKLNKVEELKAYLLEDAVLGDLSLEQKYVEIVELKKTDFLVSVDNEKYNKIYINELTLDYTQSYFYTFLKYTIPGDENVYLKIINLHSLELNRCPITNLEYGPKALVFSDAINNNLYQINYHFNKIS